MKFDINTEKYKGLTSSLAKEKLRTDGYNDLPSSKPKNFLIIASGVVKEPMFILLVACGSSYMVLDDIQEGLMLLGFVFVIMGIEFYQEKKTEKALDALKELASPRALVIRDGVETRIAGCEVVIVKIGKALEKVKEEPARLKLEMGSLVKKLTIIAAALCFLVILFYTLSRGSLVNGFMAGITFAMAMLPEEFSIILTVFMALGAWRMSRTNVLTRKPSAIETLGSATVLCTDKTGTIAQNKMTVARLNNGKDFLIIIKDVEIESEFHEIIEYGILSSQINPFDPMEKAITSMGDLYLKGTEHIHTNWEMVKEYPLSKELLAMSRVFSLKETKEKIIAAKGAPEAIFDLCHLN